MKTRSAGMAQTWTALYAINADHGLIYVSVLMKKVPQKYISKRKFVMYFVLLDYQHAVNMMCNMLLTNIFFNVQWSHIQYHNEENI